MNYIKSESIINKTESKQITYSIIQIANKPFKTGESVILKLDKDKLFIEKVTK